MRRAPAAGPRGTARTRAIAEATRAALRDEHVAADVARDTRGYETYLSYASGFSGHRPSGYLQAAGHTAISPDGGCFCADAGIWLKRYPEGARRAEWTNASTCGECEALGCDFVILCSHRCTDRVAGGPVRPSARRSR